MKIMVIRVELNIIIKKKEINSEMNWKIIFYYDE